jgi:uncharacterized RDD family membrane protein YckC
MVRNGFNQVVESLLADQPGLARDKAEALAHTIVGDASSPGAGSVRRAPMVDADVSSRCVALAVDAGCLFVIYIVVAGLIYIVSHENPPFPSELILPVVVTLYFLICWAFLGATPGMLALDLRLTTADGRRIGLRRAVIRFSALFLLCLPFGVGFVSPAISRTNRSWHDFIAGTHMVSLRDA